MGDKKDAFKQGANDQAEINSRINEVEIFPWEGPKLNPPSDPDLKESYESGVDSNERYWGTW